MKSYLDILKNVLEKGKVKFPVRKNSDGEFIPVDGEFIPVDGGVKTIGLPNIVFSHDMSDGFPLLTVRKMPWLNIRVELEGFIKGITSKKWFQEQKCKFWDQW